MVLPNRLCLIVKLYINRPELLPDTHDYVGINDIEITANVKIDGIEPGSDLSHLFEIVSFGVDGRRVFKYPSCDLAFEDADYYPQTIREFCSVNPLYVGKPPTKYP